jgi:dolichol-phosphate mannosyltransferase
MIDAMIPQSHLNPSSSPGNSEALRVVVIATFNEHDNIASLVSSIVSLLPPFHVLVVDDDSPDGTGDVVAELSKGNNRVHLLSRSGRCGYGSAVLAGFEAALRLGAQRIFTMDADHSHDFADLPRLNAALDHTQAAIGSRYRGGIRVINWAPRRLLLSLAANAYVRRVLRLPYADCTSGFRAYHREVVEKLLDVQLNSRGYAFLVEVLAAMVREKWRIEEVPIVYTERRAGQSKMSKASIAEAIIRPWLIRFRFSSGGIGRNR